MWWRCGPAANLGRRLTGVAVAVLGAVQTGAQDATGALPAARLRAAPVVHLLVVAGDPPGEGLERLALPHRRVQQTGPLTRVEQLLSAAERAVYELLDLRTVAGGRHYDRRGVRIGR